MNKEEAIWHIQDHMRIHHIGEYPHIKLAEALNMAMSALQKQDEECEFCHRFSAVPFCPMCGRKLQRSYEVEEDNNG